MAQLMAVLRGGPAAPTTMRGAADAFAGEESRPCQQGPVSQPAPAEAGPEEASGRGAQRGPSSPTPASPALKSLTWQWRRLWPTWG